MMKQNAKRRTNQDLAEAVRACVPSARRLGVPWRPSSTHNKTNNTSNYIASKNITCYPETHNSHEQPQRGAWL